MQPARTLLLPLLVAACTDYGLFGKHHDETNPPVGSDTTTPPDTATSGTCGDLDLPAAAPIATPTCTGVAPVDWTLQMEWEHPGATSEFPVIIPRGEDVVVVVSVIYEGLVVLDGRTGLPTDAFTLDGYDAYWPVTVSDDSRGNLTAAWQYESVNWWSAETLEIVRSEPVDGLLGGVVTWNDVDEDGVRDLVSELATVKEDGTVLASVGGRYSFLAATFVVGDVDVDGDVDVAGVSGIWNATTGQLSPWLGLSGMSFQGAGIGVDGDLTILGTDEVGAFGARPDGQVLWHQPFEVNSPGGIAVGDVDGDGVPEMVVSAAHRLYLFDVDGTVRWSAEALPTEAGSPAMADLDGDGRYEVITFGRSGLAIRGGADGELLAEAPDIYSGAGLASPAVADIDGDGSMEIVVSGFDRAHGDAPVTRAYGPATGRWARGRPIWNSFSYHAETTAPDGREPLSDLPATEWSTFRAQPARDGAFPDLAATEVSICCDEDTVHVVVQAANLGTVASDPATLAIATSTGSGWTEAATAALPAIPPQQTLAGTVLDVPRAEWGTERMLRISGAADDCDPENNAVMLTLTCGE
jgi:hypothetical protein